MTNELAQKPHSKVPVYFIVASLLAIPIFIAAILISMLLLAGLGLPITTGALLMAISAEVITAFALFAIVWHKSYSLREFFKLKAASLKHVALGVAVGIGLYLLLILVRIIVALVSPQADMAGSDTSNMLFSTSGAEGILVLFVIVPFVTPLVEELFFRGAILSSLRGLTPSKVRNVVAVVLSSLFFSFMHFQGFSSLPDLMVLFVTFTLGILASVLVIRTGSIWPAVALHVAYNSATVFVILALNSLA